MLPILRQLSCPLPVSSPRKKSYFIKFDREVLHSTGCARSALIAGTLEYWFSKKPDGFYKFIEPCSHKLYKLGDSWTEELGCDRKSFSKSFDKIGVRYASRTRFEEAEDKFQGKLYASFYDRYTNQTFFVRNPEFSTKDTSSRTNPPSPHIARKQAKTSNSSTPPSPFSNGNLSLSYREAKNTSNDLSKDKSHASNEIEKRMIEIWTALVGHDKEKIGLTRKRIAFLKQAFKDKFESCLEKWKKYCQDIASSRFLMGEIKSSFRATLDWALKFDIIQKILEGNYGIGDRNPSPASSACESFVKNSKIELTSEEETIQTLGNEPEHVRAFRLKWLNKFGASNYRDCLKDCTIEVGDGATLILRPSSRYNAKSIASYWTPTLLMGGPFVRVHIFQQEGDLVFDKWFGTEQSREGVSPENEGVEVKGCLDLTAAPISQSLPETTEVVNVDAAIEKLPEEVQAFGDAESGGDIPVTPETQMLRKKLRQALPPNYFPTWLGSIEVEGISQDGKIVVTLEDSLAVGWCRSRFSKEIFQSVASLWNGVNRLVIREKEGDATQSSIENPSKKPENVEEKSTFEQAIRSLLMVANQPQTCPLMKTVKTLGMQGACQALGRMG